MKLIIENVEDNDVKVTFNFKGKDYSETWTDIGSGCATTGRSIVSQLEYDGITTEGTDIEDLLTSVEVADFMSLSEREKNW